MTRSEAEERVRAAQAAQQPPGGFDAWLHLLAAPAAAGGAAPGVPAAGAGAAGPGGPGGIAGDGAGGGDPTGAGAAPPGQVWAEVVSLTAPNDPEDPLSLFFIHPQRVAARLTKRLARLAERCAAVPGCSGLVVQAGLSGMEYRALAPAPEGFVPRYRLPRRSLPEPLWAGPDPVWCPRERLQREPERIAEALVERLRQRLEGA